jgi:NAD(P)-dependent dehydrogenase (short-subunit alcohol dehydrogenase family)
MAELFLGQKVLITGALGTLGQALVARYSQEGATIFAWDRPDASNPQNTLDEIAEGVTFIGCDLNDLAATEIRRSRSPLKLEVSKYS